MDTTLQTELPLATAAPDASLDLVIAILQTEPNWITAKALLKKLGFVPLEKHKRKLRRIAENSRGQIISGQLGYRHIAHASPEEISHAANWLEHQAKEMADRATSIRRHYHQLLHTPKL